MPDPAGGRVESPCHPDPALDLLDPAAAASAAELFKALGDPTRVRLVRYIAEAPDGTACSCHLPQALGISQPTMSHHLKKLVEAGLIIREQRGRWAHFSVNRATLAAGGGVLSMDQRVAR